MQTTAFVVFALASLALFLGARRLDERDRRHAERSAREAKTPLEVAVRSSEATISFATGEQLSISSERRLESDSGEQLRPSGPA